MTAPTGPLAGVRVIEISSFIAVPYAGLSLAQLGADVIRVDRIGGGPDYRRWPLAEDGQSFYWTALNRGKRSVELDIRQPEGQALIATLLANSGPGGGVLITNAPPFEATTYEALRQHRPDLIHLQLVGARDGSTAVDYTVNASSGFPTITGPLEHSGPVNHAFPAWDFLCGANAAVAVLTALRHRERTGEGQSIRLALEDVALATTSHLGLYAEAQFGRERERVGNFVYGSYGSDFAAADGTRFMIVALTPGHWRDLITRTDRREVFAELEKTMGCDFERDDVRYRHQVLITELLAPWFAERTADQIEAQLHGASFPHAPYRSFTDVGVDGRAELLQSPVFDEVVQPGIGAVVAARFAATMTATPPVPARPSPALGADTRAVLTELGQVSAATLEALTRAGVIAPDTAGTAG